MKPVCSICRHRLLENVSTTPAAAAAAAAASYDDVPVSVCPPCGHVFHHECILRLIVDQGVNQCPQCDGHISEYLLSQLFFTVEHQQQPTASSSSSGNGLTVQQAVGWGLAQTLKLSTELKQNKQYFHQLIQQKDAQIALRGEEMRSLSANYVYNISCLTGSLKCNQITMSKQAAEINCLQGQLAMMRANQPHVNALASANKQLAEANESLTKSVKQMSSELADARKQLEAMSAKDAELAELRSSLGLGPDDKLVKYSLHSASTNRIASSQSTQSVTTSTTAGDSRVLDESDFGPFLYTTDGVERN